MTEFVGFPKMARLSREMIVTEKIDGTHAQIFITDDGQFLTGSKNRWITPGNDNYGFSAWAHEHKDELMQLGPGRHFGEWWGKGIQRNYGLDERRFSLFNTIRWCFHTDQPKAIPGPTPKLQERAPACCHIVPVLYRGVFDTSEVGLWLDILRDRGSYAAPGFLKPEGIVAYHVAGNVCFKKTLEKDHQAKSQNVETFCDENDHQAKSQNVS